MKIIEESKLKSNIRQLNKYKKANKDPIDFYNNLDSLELESLQNLSFVQDNAFFDEISFILSVIASIASHPHLANKGEDVVIRSELAGHISTESFQRMFKEPSFWKEKDLEMVPEYVHHYQYTDEMKIYENLFIGMIVKILDQEIAEYTDFYSQLIPSIDVNNTDELLENENIETALSKLAMLKRKIRFIKNTHFYKEVSKVKFQLKNLQPTNILVKDRLYNYCFRFYKKFIQYIDKESLRRDFGTYYYYLILKTLKSKNMVLDETKKNTSVSFSFIHNDYYIQLNLENRKTSILLKIGLEDEQFVSKHRLVLNTERDIEEFDKTNAVNILTTQFATLWNIKDSEDAKHYIFKNALPEKDIAEYWINNKFEERNIKQEMFTKYCPVCKKADIEEKTGFYYCSECGSIYTFKEENKAWFLRIRRL